MPDLPTFDEYVASLGHLTAHIDPTASTPEASAIKEAADSLTALPAISAESLAAWVAEHPQAVPALGLTVGLSRERLKNALKHAFGTSGWVTLTREHPADLVGMLDRDYDLIRQVETQRANAYTFGDVLVARAGTRVTATSAGVAGRKVEDEIEAIARDVGLACDTRTRFTGRNSRDAPCDLAIPNGGRPDRRRGEGLRLDRVKAVRCSPGDYGDGRRASTEAVRDGCHRRHRMEESPR